MEVKLTFSARTYIKETIERLETMVGKEFVEQKILILETLHPEIDDFPILNPTHHSKFRSLVGCANWLVTLGRFDVVYAVNTVSSFSMQSRECHFKGMIRIFGYLKKLRKGKITIDPNYPDHSLHPTQTFFHQQKEKLYLKNYHTGQDLSKQIVDLYNNYSFPMKKKCITY